MKKLVYTDRFKKLYKRLPDKLKSKVKKQLQCLVQDMNHPSLNAKKMKGRKEIWEARVDYQHRFTFQINSDSLILRAVGSHDVLKKP